MSEFRKVGPSFFSFCGTCRKVTVHYGATDEHGCERGSICAVCEGIRDPRECQFQNVRYVPAKTRRKAS